MKSLLYAWGGLHLANCLLGLLTGQMMYIFKTQQEFFPSIKWARRNQSQIFYWIFFIANLAFGGFLIYYGRNLF